MGLWIVSKLVASVLQMSFSCTSEFGSYGLCVFVMSLIICSQVVLLLSGGSIVFLCRYGEEDLCFACSGGLHSFGLVLKSVFGVLLVVSYAVFNIDLLVVGEVL